MVDLFRVHAYAQPISSPAIKKDTETRKTGEQLVAKITAIAIGLIDARCRTVLRSRLIYSVRFVTARWLAG